MEVDRGEHHVARHDEGLQRDDAAPIDADHELAVALEESQRCDQLVGIVTPRRNAGEIGVAQQVIHSVGVEVRAAHELAQRGVSALRIADNQSQYVAGIDVERGDAARDVGQRDHSLRPLLVRDPQHALARVAERSVADVVEEQRRANEPPLICRIVGVAEEARAGAEQLVEGTSAHRERAERMREPRVLRGRKREVRQAELPQTAQPLHHRQIEKLCLRCG